MNTERSQKTEQKELSTQILNELIDAGEDYWSGRIYTAWRENGYEPEICPVNTELAFRIGERMVGESETPAETDTRAQALSELGIRHANREMNGPRYRKAKAASRQPALNAVRMLSSDEVNLVQESLQLSLDSYVKDRIHEIYDDTQHQAD